MNSKIIPELGITQQQVESIVTALATSLVRDGALSAKGKTQEQFIAELRKFVKNIEIVPVIDHTEDILKQARTYNRENKTEFACLFYALWLEHALNQLISSLARRKDFSNKEIEEIIRDTSYRSKSSWLLRMLGGEPFSRHHINLIVKLMEARNSFVHYKWKAENEQANHEINAILAKIEKTVTYIRAYEKKHLLGVSKRGIKKLIKHV